MFPKTVCHVSTFSPTQCGIATYTEALICHLPQFQSLEVRIEYQHDTSLRPRGWSCIRIEDPASYDEAAEFINRSGVDGVSLQHEFGIFGGRDGRHVLRLARALRRPLVVTFHTVSPALAPGRAAILRDLADVSSAVVVLREDDREVALEHLGVPARKLKVIRHGIPNVEFVLPAATAMRQALGSQLVFITAGHIKPAKRYDVALHALAALKRRGTRFAYLIVGSEQPQFEKYRGTADRVRAIARTLGLEEEVIWVNRYLDTPTFIQHILAADIGLVMYDREDQNSSGIVPLMLGCGRIVVATAFQYAKSLAKRVDGIRVAAIGSPESVLRRIEEILEDRRGLAWLMRSNYARTRLWVWGRTAGEYATVFEDVFERRDGLEWNGQARGLHRISRPCSRPAPPAADGQR